LWYIGVAYACTWVLISWLTAPSLDGYGDMVENYAWSQAWALGSFRHPPLFAWIVGIWFHVLPTRVWAYYVLSYVNASIGVLGIVALARLWLPGTVSPDRRRVFVTAVVLFAVLSLPYSNLAEKFNADTVQLSLWPWTAYAFFGALHARDTPTEWRFTALLGLMMAAALLGKYYSALILVSLFIVSVAGRVNRRWYRTPYPYAATILALFLLLPHLTWEARAGFPFLQYMETKIDERVDPARILLFLLSGIYYLPLSWLAWLALRTGLAATRDQPVDWAIPLRELVLLCSVPAVLTCAFNVAARVHLTTHWAIPDWFALPVLLAVWLLPHVREDFPWNTFMYGVAAAWVVILAAGMLVAVYLSVTGNPRYSLGREAMVRAIEARFHARFPAQQLSWAAGTWPESGSLAFFAPNHPRALPGFPDEMPALLTPYPAWPEQYGVIVCVAMDVLARQGSHDLMCEDRTRGWLGRHHLRPIEETLTYRADGWQYRRPEEKNVTVFWVSPPRDTTVTVLR
jgi:hypothetical protein